MEVQFQDDPQEAATDKQLKDNNGKTAYDYVEKHNNEKLTLSSIVMPKQPSSISFLYTINGSKVAKFRAAFEQVCFEEKILSWCYCHINLHL